MNSSVIPTIVVALVIGIAFGSAIFPQTRTLTTTSAITQTTTQVITQTVIVNALNPIVTFTRITLLVVPVVGVCITASGTRSVTYTYASGGQSTTVITIYPPNLPQQFIATVVTASTVSGSNQTQYFTGSC